MDYKKLIEEINKRQAEIQAEIRTLKPEDDKDGKKLESLNSEFDKNEERAKAYAKAEEINERSAEALRTLVPTASAKPVEKSEDEERAERFIKEKRMEVGTKELRSILLSSGNLATPTKTSGIYDDLTKVPSILNDVMVVDAGGVGEEKVAFVKADPTAAKSTEGTASAESAPTYGYALIKPYNIDVVTYVSKLVPTQSQLAYEANVQAKALQALRRKACALIIAGDSTDFYGIENAADKDAAAMYEAKTLSTSAIGAASLREMLLSYGGDDQIAGGATLYLDKTNLQAFGAVRGTNEKKAVYDVTFDSADTTSGTIQDGGLAVRFVIVNSLGSTKMILGNPKNYQLDLFSPFSIQIDGSYKFAEGLDTVRGTASIGGNIVVKNGIQVWSFAA